jgi:hypothetical protein
MIKELKGYLTILLSNLNLYPKLLYQMIRKTKALIVLQVKIVISQLRRPQVLIKV